MTRKKYKYPIKVHRVKSEEEVKTLEKLGVDYIGFHVDDDVVCSIDPNPFWEDERYLLEEDIPTLLPLLKSAEGFVEYPYESITHENCLMLAQKGCKRIQLPRLKLKDSESIKACENNNISAIYGQLYCAPEDNPQFPEFIKNDWTLLSAFDLQIFPSEIDAWQTLSNPDTSIKSDIIVWEDIKRLIAEKPVFLGLNVSVENSSDILNKFQSTPFMGLSFTLSSTAMGSHHTFEFDELVKIIEAIRNLEA